MASAFCETMAAAAAAAAPAPSHARRRAVANTTTVSQALAWNANVRRPQQQQPKSAPAHGHTTTRDAYQGLQKADSWHFHAPSHRGTANRNTYNLIANVELGGEVNTSQNAAIAAGLVGGKKKFEVPAKAASPRRRPAVHRGCANKDTYDVIANKECNGSTFSTSHNAAIAAGLVGGKKKFEVPAKSASFRYAKRVNRAGVANRDTYDVIANKECDGTAVDTFHNAAIAAGLTGGKKRVEPPQHQPSSVATTPKPTARKGLPNQQTYDVIANTEFENANRSRGGRKFIDPNAESEPVSTTERSHGRKHIDPNVKSQ